MLHKIFLPLAGCVSGAKWELLKMANRWASLPRYFPSILHDPLSLNDLSEVTQTAGDHLEQTYPATGLFLL